MNEEQVTSEVASDSASATAPNHAPLRLSEVLNSSWQLFQAKFWNLLGISLIMSAVAGLVLAVVGIIGFILIMASFLVKVPTVTVLVGAVVVLGAIYALIWVSVWQLIAVYKHVSSAENRTVLDLLNEARPVAQSIVPTIIVSALATLGGFLLFVIPGIILSVSLAFVTVVAVLENKRMWDAFTASRNLVRGHWWRVLWVFIAYTVVMGIIVLMTGAYYSPLIVFINPLSYVLLYVLYRKLKETAPAEATGGTLWYKIFTGLGGLLIVGGIIALAVAAGSNWDKFRDNFKGEMRKEMRYEKNDQNMMWNDTDMEWNQEYEYSPDELPFPDEMPGDSMMQGQM